MICDCGLITKKRTLLDGIKLLSGNLVVFRVWINDSTLQMFIKRCCFLTLIPSLYTFIDKSWLMYTNIVIFDPKSPNASPELKKLIGSDLSIQNVFSIRQDTLDRLESFGDDTFQILFVDDAKLLASEYMNATSNFNMSYQKLIELEQIVNTLKYKYSAIVHDNELLKKASFSTNSANSQTNYEESETKNESCEKCKNVAFVRNKIKEIKKDTYEKVGKLQYELEIFRKRTLDLQEENKKLKEENAKLSDINQSYYMNH